MCKVEQLVAIKTVELHANKSVSKYVINSSCAIFPDSTQPAPSAGREQLLTYSAFCSVGNGASWVRHHLMEIKYPEALQKMLRVMPIFGSQFEYQHLLPGT